MIVFDELQKTIKEKKKERKTALFLFLHCYQKHELHVNTRYIFFYSSGTAGLCHPFPHFLSLISFIFVACVSGCNKFFELHTAGNVCLVKVLYLIPRCFREVGGLWLGYQL